MQSANLGDIPSAGLIGQYPLEFVPAHLLGGRPHVMADGAPRPGTVLTLSHWPRTPTPLGLRADLSAQSALKALGIEGSKGVGEGAEDQGDLGVLLGQPRLATIDHYDEDGVITLALLCVEGLAQRYGELLVEAARVGDFGVVLDRKAALVAFALAALVDPHRSPLPALRSRCRPLDSLAVCGIAAMEALRIMPELCESTDRFELLWKDEADRYDESVAAIAGSVVTIEEEPSLDLAVVRVPHRWGDGGRLHQAAVHSATSMMRVATIAPGMLCLRYRYESWVRLGPRSPRPLPRVDLHEAAAELQALEKGQARWVFDGASSLKAALHTAGDEGSELDPEQFLDVVRKHLSRGDAQAPAWDPYDD